MSTARVFVQACEGGFVFFSLECVLNAHPYNLCIVILSSWDVCTSLNMRVGIRGDHTDGFPGVRVQSRHLNLYMSTLAL